MRKTYAESYSPILFLRGNGKSMAYDERFNIKNNTLSIPPDNSIEYSLNSIESEAFYISLTPDFNKLTLSRFKGSQHTPHRSFIHLTYIKDIKVCFSLKTQITPI